MKRLLDILFSYLALLVLSPLLLLLALWIKLDSPGPVFFRQERVGRYKRPFFVYKFRSMSHRDPGTIDQQSERVVSSGDDDRITSSGRLLRALSLDELPQLINVALGNMSLVGPRPIIPEQLEVVPHWFEARFRIRPGITGLAQVKGRRSLSWEEQLIYDNEYAENQTFWGDMKILLLTFWVVLARKGIYGDDSKNWRAYREEWKQHSNSSPRLENEHQKRYLQINRK